MLRRPFVQCATKSQARSLRCAQGPRPAPCLPHPHGNTQLVHPRPGPGLPYPPPPAKQHPVGPRPTRPRPRGPAAARPVPSLHGNTVHPIPARTATRGSAQASPPGNTWPDPRPAIPSPHGNLPARPATHGNTWSSPGPPRRFSTRQHAARLHTPHANETLNSLSCENRPAAERAALKFFSERISSGLHQTQDCIA